MKQTSKPTALAQPAPVVDMSSKTITGFWVYLMTDCVLFASLFAVYAVLHNNTFGGPSGAQLFNLPDVLAETLCLLTSSFTCGLGVLAAYRQAMRHVIVWFSLTFILGATFLYLEISEFSRFVHMGDSWSKSGFLSAFFTLVGTHGLHISVGLLWLLIMMIQVIRKGLGENQLRRLTMFSLFWHFLDLIWIFIFTIVYLMGVQ
jgi:cytochrome o ubiquinol oxidase subunit 3